MTFLSVVSVAAGIMFGIGAIAAVYRIIRGPSILDRALATDVLLAIAICALGAEMAINTHTDTLVGAAGARDVRGRRLDLDRAVHGEAGRAPPMR